MQEVSEFLKVVQNNEFLEGHEVLEDKWREWKNDPQKREESFILKALINASTALALKIKKKHTPANQVWDTYKKYENLIDTIPSVYTPLYKKAQSLVLQKYEEFFICKSTGK